MGVVAAVAGVEGREGVTVLLKFRDDATTPMDGTS